MKLQMQKVIGMLYPMNMDKAMKELFSTHLDMDYLIQVLHRRLNL